MNIKPNYVALDHECLGLTHDTALVGIKRNLPKTCLYRIGLLEARFCFGNQQIVLQKITNKYMNQI